MMELKEKKIKNLEITKRKKKQRAQCKGLG
jgi:hypothetical protein